MSEHFRYELLSLDTGKFATLIYKFFGKPKLILHGQYSSKEKATKHLNLFHKQGKHGVFLRDNTTGQVSK